MTTAQPDEIDRPRRISRRPVGGDLAFRYLLTGVGGFVLVITGAVGVFLALKLVPTFRAYGFDFLSSPNFDLAQNHLGIASAMLGSLIIAVIALVIAVPISLGMALYITEYAPRAIRPTLVAIMDLMAAVPSLIFGAWGFFQLQHHIAPVSRWLATWFGWIPIFDIPGMDQNVPVNPEPSSRFSQSALVAGAVVALMVVPLATSVMRNVFDQAPPGEREGAFALGATRWGVIRSVVLPFGRGGMVGGFMLGLGRALGETIAVLFLLSPDYRLKVSITEQGGVTISSLVAGQFGGVPDGSQRNGLLAAGFVLFVMTLVVNTAASVIVARSRSGAGVD